VEQPFVNFVAELRAVVEQHGVHNLQVQTFYQNGGQLYRAAAWYLGDVWRDWAWVDWGGNDGIQPAKIWGFVDLNNLHPHSNVEFGGLKEVEPGFYAIVKNAEIQRRLTANQW
jgi:hypothetical protein